MKYTPNMGKAWFKTSFSPIFFLQIAPLVLFKSVLLQPNVSQHLKLRQIFKVFNRFKRSLEMPVELEFF